MGFGRRVHNFAENYVLGADVTPSNEHEERIQAFIDGLDGELFAEEDAVLPLKVDGERVAITGVVDLVCVTADRVEIIDYKTDGSRRAQDEYRKQLSVYYHVLSTVYPDREVTASLFYSSDGERVAVGPLSTEELQALVQAVS